MDSQAHVNGGGGCIERLGSLWSLRGAAVEPCPAWVEGVQQRRLRRHGGQLSAHTPTDHRRGSLCPQVAAWQYKHGNRRRRTIFEITYSSLRPLPTCPLDFMAIVSFLLDSTLNRAEQNQQLGNSLLTVRNSQSMFIK